MSEAEPIEQKVRMVFEMADAEGTAPMRVVAGHMQRVGEGWVTLSKEMFDLADSLDRLVDGQNR